MEVRSYFFKNCVSGESSKADERRCRRREMSQFPPVRKTIAVPKKFGNLI